MKGSGAGPTAEVTVRSPRAARRLLSAGGIGLAEGWIDGDWDSDDVEAVLELAAVNVAVTRPPRVPAPFAPFQRLLHRLRPNTRRGARRNIEAHYDLGNEFYELWLDPTMAYSSASFEDDTPDLERAQVRKWDRILELIQPGPGDHLLEIGCGWGGLACHAARESGCRVTGITISPAQREGAHRRVEEADLGGRVDIQLRDYRDVHEHYDGVMSVEMLEAVGERYWPSFFSTVRKVLGRGGRAALQVITIGEERFDAYRRRADFIQKYVFPGGMLPSPSALVEQARAAGLRAEVVRSLGRSYAWTLQEWARRFEGALPDVHRLGFDERFARLWRYYLAYCRAGFLAGTIDVVQTRVEPTR